MLAKRYACTCAHANHVLLFTALRSTGTCLFLGTGASPHQRLLGQGLCSPNSRPHHPKQSQTQTHCPTYCQMHWPIRCNNYCPSPCLFHWQHLHRPLLGSLYHQAPQRLQPQYCQSLRFPRPSHRMMPSRLLRQCLRWGRQNLPNCKPWPQLPWSPLPRPHWLTQFPRQSGQHCQEVRLLRQ